LQEAVRLRCALPVYTTETLITSAAILSFLQESARKLSLLLDDDSWYFVTTTNVPTVANVASVALPPNFSSLYRVHWVRDANTLVPLEQANLEEIPANPSLAWDACVPRYRLREDALELFPTPQAAYTLSLRYSTGAFIATAADTLVGQLGWDTWIIYNACCIVRQRQEKDYAEFAQERAQALDDVKAARRDRNGVKQPRDVAGLRHSGGPWPHRWWGY
jgi:hypothetical protein